VIEQPANNLVTSDLPTPDQNEWLEEPTLPKKDDFKNPENFEFAFNEYKHKMVVYQARLALHKGCEKVEEANEKYIFKCFFGKKYPNYKDFCPLDPEEKALGYGGAAKQLGFKPALVADWISKNEKFKTDMATGILYFFNGKCWTPNAEPFLEKIISLILREENRQSHQNNITQSLRPLTYEKIEFSRKIACENCLLDVETQTTSEFSEKELPFHEVPVKYDPEAKCPNWEAFIAQVVNGDDLATIQEWSGFLLLADYRFHKLLWVHGSGRNGKGVWQRTMEAILGEKNVSGIGLEEFNGSHRFALRQLYGKLFNICSEPNTSYPLQTPLLKKATGQDTIEAEIKGKQARLSFRNYAKITVLANKFPKVEDTTTAFKERRLFIKFPNEFIGTNQIQNVEDNWLKTTDERSGILNWMLQGLKRLLEQGYFTESKTQQETETEFLRASDTISAFIKECSVFGKNLAVLRSEAWDSYNVYCEFYGLDAEKAPKFTERLKGTVHVTSGKIGGVRAWRGISFNKISEEGTLWTVGTLFAHCFNSDDCKNINKSTEVPQVSQVSSLETKKSTLINSSRFKPAAGVRCQQIEQDEQCTKEAEYTINGNLYCPTCFEVEKENLRKQGKIICVENTEGAS
jgi:P4 family phage/plasmid primase-like protien